MTDEGRYVGADPLALAEAVAAGEFSEVAAESALRSARGRDTSRADADVAEMRELLAAIRGVRRHADAFQRAADEAGAAGVARAAGAAGVERSTPPGAGPTPVRGLQTIEPRRVDRGDVRLRPNRPVDRPRWAMPGVVAAAAVIVVAVVVGAQLTTSRIAATPSPSSPIAIVSPAPTPSSSPAIAPTPTVVPTPTVIPGPTGVGVTGVPPIVSETLGGTPGVVYWTLPAEDRVAVTEWTPDGFTPTFTFDADTWPDKARGDGIWIERHIVASPDARHVAFAESDQQATERQRLRVFDPTGALEWTDPAPLAQPDLAWSADGSRLAIGQQPGLWRIVTFGSGAPRVTTLDLGGAYALLGFSVSGHLLYGYQTEGEQEFWGTPITYPVAGGAVRSIGKFSGQADPIAASNGTTVTTSIAQDAGTVVQPGIDPKTGHVLDTGGLSGQLQGWELRDGTSHSPLDFGSLGTGGLLGLGWGPLGSIVVASSATADSSFRLNLVEPSQPSVALARPTFNLPSGTYWQSLEGVRGTTVLLGLGADRAHDSLELGADELVAVDLSSARADVLQAAVLVPDDPGLTGIHLAGWVTVRP